MINYRSNRVVITQIAALPVQGSLKSSQFQVAHRITCGATVRFCQKELTNKLIIAQYIHLWRSMSCEAQQRYVLELIPHQLSLGDLELLSSMIAMLVRDLLFLNPRLSFRVDYMFYSLFIRWSFCFEEIRGHWNRERRPSSWDDPMSQTRDTLRVVTTRPFSRLSRVATVPTRIWRAT